MKYDSNKFNRHTSRLINYDYSQIGMYYITICTKFRECLFGEIKNKKMILNEFGKIVEKEWLKTPLMRKNFEMDEYTIMPNHFHGIVVILYQLRRSELQLQRRGELQFAPTTTTTKYSMKPASISSFVSGFKSTITKQVNIIRGVFQYPVWQTNYYERIIRNERELCNIRNYIRNNPINWQKDRNNPNNLKFCNKNKLYVNNVGANGRSPLQEK